MKATAVLLLAFFGVATASPSTGNLNSHAVCLAFPDVENKRLQPENCYDFWDLSKNPIQMYGGVDRIQGAVLRLEGKPSRHRPVFSPTNYRVFYDFTASKHVSWDGDYAHLADWHTATSSMYELAPSDAGTYHLPDHESWPEIPRTQHVTEEELAAYLAVVAGHQWVQRAQYGASDDVSELRIYLRPTSPDYQGNALVIRVHLSPGH